MSDIAIIIPAWPFLVSAGIAAVIAAGLGWAAVRVSGWRGWVAGGFGLVVGLAALAAGAFGLALADGY